MKTNKSKIKNYILFIIIPIIILGWVLLNDKDEINVSNIKWNTIGNNCELTFNLENLSRSFYKLDISIDLYNHRQSHNDNYQLLGKKNISVDIYPSEKISIKDSVLIEVLNRVTKVQVIIKDKEVL